MLTKLFLVAIISVQSMFGITPVCSVASEEIVTKYYSDTAYLGDTTEATYYNVVIEFDSYELADVHLTLTCPVYECVSQSNSCAPMAGAIVVTYYDATKENLIPDYTPGSYWNGKYYFNAQNSTFNAMKEEVYDYMGTNTVHPGTSVDQFKTGLANYVTDHGGYNTSYNSCGDTFNLETAKTYLSQQKPLVLFLNSYIYYSAAGVALSENRLAMVAKEKTVGHTVVVYGYQEYKFYDADGNNFRTEKFLVTVFGDGTQGYLSVNDVSGIDEAYAVTIV